MSTGVNLLLPSSVESVAHSPASSDVDPASSDAVRQAESWARVVELLRQDYINPDVDAVNLICACLAAHRITQHPPVWVMGVAPSGSLKTVVLQSFDGLSGVHFVD